MWLLIQLPMQLATVLSAYRIIGGNETSMHAPILGME